MPTEQKDSEINDDDLNAVKKADEPVLLSNLSDNSSKSCKTEQLEEKMLINQKVKDNQTNEEDQTVETQPNEEEKIGNEEKQIDAQPEKEKKIDSKEKEEETAEAQTEEEIKKKKTIFEREQKYEKSKWWEKMLYTWTFELIATSKERKLTHEDFGGIKEQDTVEENVKQITEIYDKQPKKEKNIMYAVAKTFQWEFVQFYCVEFFLSFLRLTEPISVQKMVVFLQDDKGNPWDGMKLLLFMIACQCTHSLVGHQMGFRARDLGHRAYRSMNSVVYNKQLRLSPATSKNFSHGEINHYAQGAVGMIIHMCFDAVNLCRIPFYFIYCVYSLIGLLGFNLLTAVFLMIFQMYFGHWVHSRSHRKHHKLGKASERRRKYMSETVYSSKILKFYNWNEPFEKEILKWRGKETKLRWEISRSDIGTDIISSFLPRIQNPLICASLFYFGGTLDLGQSMQLTHMLGMLNGQLHHYPHIQRMWAYLRIQIQVLQRYLDCQEVEEGTIIQQDKKGDIVDPENEYAIRINNHSFSWGIKTRNEMEEELQRRKFARDDRRNAWFLTKAFNKVSKITDKAIKKLTKKTKKAKTYCRCEIQCFEYKCRCATNCLEFKQYDFKLKIEKENKIKNELIKKLKEEREKTEKEALNKIEEKVKLSKNDIAIVHDDQTTTKLENPEATDCQQMEEKSIEKKVANDKKNDEDNKDSKYTKEKKNEQNEHQCKCEVQCFKEKMNEQNEHKCKCEVQCFKEKMNEQNEHKCKCEVQCFKEKMNEHKCRCQIQCFKEKKKEEDEHKCKCKVQCFKKQCRCAIPCRLVNFTKDHCIVLDELVSLKDIDLHIKKGEFTCIIGECGSGKSSLLSTIIGDLIYVDPSIIEKYGTSIDGMKKSFNSFKDRDQIKELSYELVNGVNKLFRPPIKLNGSTAYAQQTPWIQNMTIRDNILYGEELDKGHYYDTIKLCELERDFEILPAGDLTEIGERGINLSGGQKARIGLARAVYAEKDIYLMDDPISALDAEVRKNIFKNLIFGHLKDKTCVLVTHAIDFLSYAHKVVVMEKGKIVTQGTFDEVKDHEIVKKLLKVNDLNKNKVTEKLNKEGQVVKCEQSDQDFDSEEEKEKEKEKEDKKDNSELTKEEKDLTMAPSYTYKDLSKEEKNKKFRTLGRITNKNDGKCIRDDDDEDIKVGIETYEKLFELFGGVKYIIFACFISALLCYIRIRTDYVIAQWGNDFELQKTKYGQFIILVASFALSSLVSESIKSMIMMVLNMRAYTDMHNKMVHKIIRAPQNLFFDTHSNSSIMGRMNDCLGTLEHHLANLFVDIVGQFQNMFSIIWIIYLANWRILLVFPFIAMFSGTLYFFMMPAHKSICNLLGETDRPIGNLRNESIAGNSTIRAFKKEKQFMGLNTKLLDNNILIHRTSMAIWMWFGNSNCLNLNVLSFLSCTIMLFYKGTSSTDAIWRSMVLQRIWDLHGSLWGLLHQVQHLDSRMVKVLKCFETLQIPQEKIEAKTILSQEELKTWPSDGTIIYQDVYMRYRPDCDLVLKGVDFNIKGGEKIGIVGRTGAGKSTLINIISRICEIEKGNMIIDGVNISDIPLNQLRDAITVIPQDPTLFDGSIRFNIDPMNQHPDEEIMNLLIRAGLEKLLTREKTEEQNKRGNRRRKRIFYDDSDSQSQSSSSESSEDDKDKDEDDKKDQSNGPLDMAIQEGGNNLSSGEKQLLCICRAALRKRKIIVLDEATANIDLITEQKIQKFMAEEFQNTTMIVIAHRLQTIIESDKVLVMGDGKVKEFDKPQTLMKNKNSHFTKLVNHLKKIGDKNKPIVEEEKPKEKKHEVQEEE